MCLSSPRPFWATRAVLWLPLLAERSVDTPGTGRHGTLLFGSSMRLPVSRQLLVKFLGGQKLHAEPQLCPNPRAAWGHLYLRTEGPQALPLTAVLPTARPSLPGPGQTGPCPHPTGGRRCASIRAAVGPMGMRGRGQKRLQNPRGLVTMWSSGPSENTVTHVHMRVALHAPAPSPDRPARRAGRKRDSGDNRAPGAKPARWLQFCQSRNGTNHGPGDVSHAGLPRLGETSGTSRPLAAGTTRGTAQRDRSARAPKQPVLPARALSPGPWNPSPPHGRDLACLPAPAGGQAGAWAPAPPQTERVPMSEPRPWCSFAECPHGLGTD